MPMTGPYAARVQLLGHGIDIVEVARIRELMDKHPQRFTERCFTPAERAYAARRPKREAEHLAARFAAKEAVLKALGTGRRFGIAWTDIEVRRLPTGQPALHLEAEAAVVAQRLGIREWSLSLSHVATHATASAVGMGLRPIPALPDGDRTQYDRQRRGLSYQIDDPYLGALIGHAKRLCDQFNATPSSDFETQEAILRQLFGSVGERPQVLAPLHVDFGRHIHVGDRFFANHGLVVLDCAEVTVGNDCFFGPNVQIYTPHHPIDPAHRAARWETALPVGFGDRVWLGGGTVVLPGVRIGSDTTIGAGSVVTKDIPAGVVAAGNPCRVLRNRVDEDRRTPAR